MQLSTKGFTLIELIVVIAIIGILATIGTSSYSNVLKSSRDTKRKTDMIELKKAILRYNIETGKYPAGPLTGALQYLSNGDSKTNPTDWIIGLTPDYVNKLPTDPLGNSTNYYQYFELSPAGYGAELTAILEKTSTPFVITITQ